MSHYNPYESVSSPLWCDDNLWYWTTTQKAPHLEMADEFKDEFEMGLSLFHLIEEGKISHQQAENFGIFVRCIAMRLLQKRLKVPSDIETLKEAMIWIDLQEI